MFKRAITPQLHALLSSYPFTGFLPRINYKKQVPTIAYGNYLQTSVEKDIRQLINIKDVLVHKLTEKAKEILL